MIDGRIRVFEGSRDGCELDEKQAQMGKPPSSSPAKVTVTVAAVFPALADALASGRSWLNDFQDDEITIPSDLYEVILAYQHYRRMAA